MAGVLAFSTLAVAKPASEKEERERVANAGRVMKEILDVPDDIPQDVLDKARCVVVLPSVVKAAFVVGGSYGRGVMVRRRGHDYNGPWGAPAMMALEGGSVGFQIGGQATDFVILVMNDRGMNSMPYSKVKLGGDASIAAGPKGRTASAGIGRNVAIAENAELFSCLVEHSPAYLAGRLDPCGLDGGANEKAIRQGRNRCRKSSRRGKREGPEEGRLPRVAACRQASPGI